MKITNANAAQGLTGGECWTFEIYENLPVSIPDRPPIGKCESPPELIWRLSREFYPLNVAVLAVPFLASEPFNSRGLVMAVTREWQRYRRERKEAR